MSDESPSTLRRRGFLGRLLGGSIAVAAGTLPAAPLLGESRRRDGAAGGVESAHAALIREEAGAADVDMSWVTRITAPRRIVFDCAEIEEGVALHHARITLANYAEIEKTTDADWSVVLTIRHAAVPMLANDVLWGKYAHLGKSTRLRDPATGKRATRNPFLNANVRESDRYALHLARRRPRHARAARRHRAGVRHGPASAGAGAGGGHEAGAQGGAPGGPGQPGAGRLRHAVRHLRHRARRGSRLPPVQVELSEAVRAQGSVFL